jgi:hypothetical protein
MGKKYKVIMLPTGKFSGLESNYKTPMTTLRLTPEGKIIGNFGGMSVGGAFQELYFVSMNKNDIEEGVAVWNQYLGESSICTGIAGKIWNEKMLKIVATTDKVMLAKDKISYGKESGKEIDVLIPFISKSFVLLYIQSYNEGKPITEVELEMENINRGFQSMASNNVGSTIIPDKWVPKVDAEGCVIVHLQPNISSAEEFIRSKKGDMAVDLYDSVLMEEYADLKVKEAVKDYEEVIEDHKRLVRELDLIVNKKKAAKQASLCDLVSQLRDEWPKRMGEL